MALGSVLVVHGVPFELVVPDHVKELTVVHLIEGGPDRIVRGVARAAGASLKVVIDAAGKRELLAEFVGLNRAAQTGMLSGRHRRSLGTTRH